MKQYLLFIVSALSALIAIICSIDIHPYHSQSVGSRKPIHLYNCNQTAEVFPQTVDPDIVTLQMPLQDAKRSTTAETDEPMAVLSPLPILPMDVMSEVSPSQLPPLDAGMVNVTGGRGVEGSQAAGYRVNIYPGSFALSIPYDPSLLPQGFTEDEIQTYVFDRQSGCWLALQRDSVNEEALLVCSQYRAWEKGLPSTQNVMSNPQDMLQQVQDMMSMDAQGDGGGNSPLDFINAVLKTPEMPETSAYTPTSIKELKAANPLEGLTLMQPPTANNNGTANMSYPIEIPAGRQGMQPNLALTYNSGGGNGWLGIGWDIPIPSITVETRWGVPRYDANLESEVYVYEGEQLVTYDSAAGDFRKLPHRTNQWTSRHDLDNDGYEQFYPRKNEAFDSIVRHGNGPSNYWWSVTHKNGVTDYYGKYVSDSGVDNSCVLRTEVNNTSGAIAHWALAESVDPFGNSVRYYYDIEHAYNGKQIYIDSISYTCFNNGNLSENGYYSIVFVRSNDRNDVMSSCNRGFKEVTADKLCHLLVQYQDTVLRQYVFASKDDRCSNYKTILTDIVRIDSPRVAVD